MIATRDDPAAKFTIQDEADPADIRFLEDGLTEFNAEAIGIADGRLLAVFARSETGSPTAGAFGWTWAGICRLQYVYVAPELRRTRMGTRLMEAVEREARGRGCEEIVLETYDFQAPEFYRKLEFEMVTTVPDHPQGHRLLIMRKRLRRMNTLAA